MRGGKWEWGERDLVWGEEWEKHGRADGKRREREWAQGRE